MQSSTSDSSPKNAAVTVTEPGLYTAATTHDDDPETTRTHSKSNVPGVTVQHRLSLIFYACT